jgi:hypothetical protein
VGAAKRKEEGIRIKTEKRMNGLKIMIRLL